MTGLLTDARGVYRSIAILDRYGRRGGDDCSLLFETAEPFELRLATGETLLIDVSGAHALAKPETNWTLLLASARVVLSHALQSDVEVGNQIGRYRGLEIVIGRGDDVEVVGYRDDCIDTFGEALARQPPKRVFLTHRGKRPLIIILRRSASRRASENARVIDPTARSGHCTPRE